MPVLHTVLRVAHRTSEPCGDQLDKGISGAMQKFELRPIGRIRETTNKTRIVLYQKFRPGLSGLKKGSEIWVLWWFHRNDNPRMRATLKVHPRGNPANPLTGVFATRAPMRPNPIALSRRKILSVNKNVVEIDSIDAFPDTPVLDIKP